MTALEFGRLSVRFVLATILLVAGLAKLAHRQASVQALRDFGVSRRLQPLGALLPPLEIAVATGFLFAASAWYAAWGALALLSLFIAGMTANLARGHQPVCACFGQVHAKPISWRTLLRNGVLAACATWLIASGPPPPVADLWVFLSRLDSRGRRLATVVAAVIGFAVLQVLKRDEPNSDPTVVDELEVPVSPSRAAATVIEPEVAPVKGAAAARVLTGIGLAVGTPAPGFVVRDLTGQLHSLDSLRAASTPILLLFSSPSCESCQALVSKLPGLAALHEQTLRVVLVTRGTVQQNREKLNDPGTLPVLLQQEYEVAEAYDCASTPSAVVVGADGLIQSRLAVGALAIEQLIASRT